jgi:uncharacterized Tic20 family protein
MTQQPPDPPPVDDSGFHDAPPQQPAPPPYANYQPRLESQQIEDVEARNWAMYCHLAVFAGYIIPFGNIIGPLVIWLIKREQYPAVDYHGKEALNFQISVMIYMLVSVVLIFVVIGILAMIAVGITSLVCTIIAVVKASRGEYYRYPMSMRFIT